MAVDIKQYVPEFYETLYGNTNTVTLSAEVLQQVLSDIQALPMNNWDNLAVLNQEFKTDKVIVSGFRIRDTSFLKSFFKFKGTNSDLQYVLNNLGYESVIYNDGGILHLADEPDEEGRPKYDIVDVTGYGKSTPCAIEIQIHIDLDNPNYSGFSSQGFGGLKDVCEERINMCSFLDKISVSAMVTDNYPFEEITDEVTTLRKIPDIEDEYFEEYSLPPIIYGQEYNENLKYERTNKQKTKKIYGQDRIKLFRPLDDEISIREHKRLQDQVLNLNSTEGAGILLTDSATARRFNGVIEAYSVTDSVTETLEIRRKSYRTFEDNHPSEHMNDSVHIMKTTHRDFTTKYGKENNGALQYLKTAITKFGDLFNPPEDTRPIVTETWWDN